MKKTLYLLCIVFIAAAFVFIAATEEEEAPEVKEVEEAEPMVGGDELDPWIAGLWDAVEKYRIPLDPSFRGPNGEEVTWDRDSLGLTVSEVAKVRAGNYTVGLPWGSLQGDYFSAWRRGTLDACKYLNLKIVAETDAGFNPEKQKSDVESMMPLKPDVLIAAPTDATTGAATFQPAVDAGILLSFVSVIPTGYVRGRDYIGCSTANAHGMGITAAQLAKDVFGKGGKIGYVYWAFEYWFTNYHDSVFAENVVKEPYGIEIIDSQDFVTPDDAYNVVSAMIMRNPEIEGFYISYMTPAIAGAEACVAAGRDDIKIITGAFDAPTLLNMAKGGNIAGFFTDTTYLVGVHSVLVAAYGLLGKEGPEYTVCPSVPIIRENIREIWDVGIRIPLMEDVDKALREAGY
ncbi:MAG: substrate-binding domain-containing protein [Spirochaetota bacterium]|nr:MAG: substrate-binding domain-containing protein [Spirochaetota bacterium]